MLNARGILSFFSSKTGLVLLFLAGVGILLAITYYGTSNAQRQEDDERRLSNAKEIPPVTSTTTRPVAPAPAAVSTPTPPPWVPPAPTPEPTERAAVTKKRAPLNLYSASPTPAPTPGPTPLPPIGEYPYAPFGRMLQCRLVNTVESINTRTPIIAVTTENLWWDGRIVIPAGTELHGTGSPDALRDRISAEGTWRAIIANTADFPDGAELELAGLALDMEVKVSKTGQVRWGEIDGSAGLKGDVLKNDKWAEVKLFASQIISGAAAGFTPTQASLLGPIPVAGPQTAGINAITQPLNTYAENILNSIERDGFFVRVPGGKQFYLYVTQPIDMRYARLARSPQGDQEKVAQQETGSLPLSPEQLRNLILANSELYRGVRQSGEQQQGRQDPRNSELEAMNQQNIERNLQILRSLKQQQQGQP